MFSLNGGVRRFRLSKLKLMLVWLYSHGLLPEWVLSLAFRMIPRLTEA